MASHWPPGLRQAEQLPAVIFTPATKAAVGDHDENISFAQAAALVGEPLAARVRDTAIALYRFAAAHAARRGIIIADTKFEFGVAADRRTVPDRRGTDSRLLALLGPPTATRSASARPPSTSSTCAITWRRSTEQARARATPAGRSDHADRGALRGSAAPDHRARVHSRLKPGPAPPCGRSSASCWTTPCSGSTRKATRSLPRPAAPAALIDSELTLRATSLVYITLLALIPLIALAFALLKAFGAQSELEPFLLEFFRPVGDGGPELVHRLMHFAEGVNVSLVGVFGLALLLWTLVGTVNRVEDSMNYVWRVQRARSIPRRVVEFVTLVTLGPLVVFAVIGFSKVAIDSVAAVRDFSFGAQMAHAAIRFAPYAIVTGLFTAIYIMMPNTRVRFWPALGGGFIAGVVWVALGKGFTGLVIHSSR